MILGKIFGKITTTEFQFEVASEARKFEYIQVYHSSFGYVLCQILEMERSAQSTTAKCTAIGYLDDQNKVRQIRTPFEPGSEVLRAEDGFIRQIINIQDCKKGAYLGMLDGKNIKVFLDLHKLLTKHVAVLAKSGAGKSYTVGALVEAIMDSKVPLLIIDPHGEYSQMKYPNDKDHDLMQKFEVEPQSYISQIQEYGDPEIDKNLRRLLLSENLTSKEILDIMPSKLSPSQTNLLYSAINSLDHFSFANLKDRLAYDENPAKFSLMSTIDYIASLSLFSANPTSLNELITPGKCSIINLRGIDPQIQEIIVYKLMKDIFEQRKKGKIPPLFTVIEEAHNFAPERNFGDAKSTGILRTIASEGRKFGLGLCVISQRPARIDKSVLSQCSTQIILKVTNPNDLKAISHSVEGLSAESENEIKNLPIGSAIVTGIVDVPLLINVRPRKSKHGGEAVDILKTTEDEQIFDEISSFSNAEIIPVILPRISLKDMSLMNDEDVKEITTTIVPAVMFTCSDNTEFNILADLSTGGFVLNDDSTAYIPDLSALSAQELKLLKHCFTRRRVSKSGLLIDGFGEDIDLLLRSLVQKGYLVKENEDYVLGTRYILSKLSHKSFSRRIEYINMKYTEKAQPTTTKEQASQAITRFARVLDSADCYIVRYKMQFQKKADQIKG